MQVNAHEVAMSLAQNVSGLISTRYVRFRSSGQVARCMHEVLPDGRPGADDEDPRSDLSTRVESSQPGCDWFRANTPLAASRSCLVSASVVTPICENCSCKARDLLYIDNHVDTYLTFFAKPEASIGQVFNFCTGEKLTVRALTEKVRDMTGFRGSGSVGHNSEEAARYPGSLRRFDEGEIRTWMGSQSQLKRRPSPHDRLLA